MKKILFSNSILALMVGFLTPAVSSTDVEPNFGANRKLFSYYSQDPTLSNYGVSRGSLPNDFKVSHKYLKNDAFKIMLKSSELQGSFDSNGHYEYDPVKSPDAFLASNTFFLLNNAHNRMGADLNYLKSARPDSKPLQEAIKLWDVAKTERTTVYPKNLAKNVYELNAWYQRVDTGLKSDRSLTFLYSGNVLTSESADIVNHELGHEMTDKIRPTFYDSHSDETGALHEWSGDAFAFFNCMADFNVVKNVASQTGGDFHLKNDAGSMAESFGRALKMKSGSLRDADVDITVAHAGKEVHDLSVVGMGSLYDTFAAVTKDAFLKNSHLNSDLEIILIEGAAYMRRLWVATLVEIPVAEPTLADVGLTFQRVAQDYKFSDSCGFQNMEWGKHMHDEMAKRGVNMTPSGASVVSVKKMSSPKGLCGLTFNISPKASGIDSSADDEILAADQHASREDKS